MIHCNRRRDSARQGPGQVRRAGAHLIDKGLVDPQVAAGNSWFGPIDEVVSVRQSERQLAEQAA